MKEFCKTHKPHLSMLKSTKSTFSEEFNYGAGRADVVYSNTDTKALEKRIKLGMDEPISDGLELKVFLTIDNKDLVEEKEFYETITLRKRKVRKAIEYLESKGFLERTHDGIIKSNPDLQSHIKTAVAVELKLSKWKKALEQAERSKSYSEYQFVALDEDRIRPAKKNIDKFRSKNVGLLGIDVQEGWNVHYTPDSSTPYSPFPRWSLNERTLKKLNSN
ncbi:MAG: hypothetical protein ABEJ98_03135 [Candidatus Nanohaloarchaea archaeon]